MTTAFIFPVNLQFGQVLIELVCAPPLASALIFNPGRVHQRALLCSTDHQQALIRSFYLGRSVGIPRCSLGFLTSPQLGFWGEYPAAFMRKSYSSLAQLLKSPSVTSASFSVLRQSWSPDPIRGEENRLFLLMVEW